MSGIMGMVATHNIFPCLLQGMHQMHRTDHNACGLVVHGHQGESISPARLHRHRRAQGVAGWIDTLARTGHTGPAGLRGFSGMGYTGHETEHGNRSLQLTLPQLSQGPKADLNSPARVAVVMRGHLHDPQDLREVLKQRGYLVKSQSDAELMAHLIDAVHQGNPVQALHRALNMLTGIFSMGVMFHDHPDRLFAAQKGTSLHWGKGATHMAWASEGAAMPSDTQTLGALADGHVLDVHHHAEQIMHTMHP